MNRERVLQAIAVMERVKDRGDKFGMGCWDSMEGEHTSQDVEETLHACGTAACFGGWLSGSREWRKFGGTRGRHGEPVFEGLEPGRSVGLFLGVTAGQAEALMCIGGGESCWVNDEFIEPIYGKDIDDITVDDVLHQLYYLRDYGTLHDIQKEIIESEDL